MDMKDNGFRLRDLYGDKFGGMVSTHEETVPEVTDQAALANIDEVAPNPKVRNHTGILTWMGILVLFIVLMQFGREVKEITKG